MPNGWDKPEKLSPKATEKATLLDIYDICEKKVIADANDDAAGTPHDSLPDFLKDFFMSKYGLKKLAHEKQVMETQYHHDKRFAVQCLRAQNGAKLKGSIGEGSNHSNYSDQSSVKILGIQRKARKATSSK